MQLKKNLINLSELDCNSPNSFNIHKSLNKVNISNSENSKERKNLTKNRQSLEEKNNEYYINILDKGDFHTNSPENNIFPISNNDDSKTKIDNTRPYIQDIENYYNYNSNDNDENFFNFSFYKNKNNNKNINNNYNNKLNENKEITNNSSDEEQKDSQNIFQMNNNQRTKSHTEQTIQNFPNLQNNESYNDNRNSFFSIENSNTNFKKKSKHKKQFKVRLGDWICPKCENLNFSFRNKCNRCGLSKEKIEHNNNRLQSQERNLNNLDNQRPIMFNNININYIFNYNFPLNNINILYNPILFNTNNINNYYGNYNNYQIYYPCNVNIK